MYHAPHGGSPPKNSQKLRETVKQMLNNGMSPARIRQAIVEDKNCTAIDKHRLLKEMHMEE